MPFTRKAVQGRGWRRRGFTRPPGLQKKVAKARQGVLEAGRAAKKKLSSGLRQMIRQAAVSAAKIAKEKGLPPGIAARAAARAAWRKFRETGAVS